VPIESSQVASRGALSQAWTSAEASLPLGWRVTGLWRFDELWGALNGSGAGGYGEQLAARP
jgi:hypothetical protein